VVYFSVYTTKNSPLRQMGSFLIFVTQNVFYFLPEYPLIDSEKTELSFHYPKTSFLMSPAFLDKILSIIHNSELICYTNSVYLAVQFFLLFLVSHSKCP
jgi:hypothetical protein